MRALMIRGHGATPANRRARGAAPPTQRAGDVVSETVTPSGLLAVRSCATISATVSLPSIVRGDGDTLFDVREGSSDGLVLFLYIDFTIKNRDVRGFIALLMGLPSIAALKDIVRDFIDGIGRQTAAGHVG